MKNYFRFAFLALSLLAIISSSCTPKKATYQRHCVAFYNLENLFDTINDPFFEDEEFLPEGKKNWTSDKYLEKLDNMAKAIQGIGLTESSPDGAVLLGVCELENAGVMADLANTEALKDRNYEYVHYDSPYYRGMDVALFYQPAYFKVISSSSHELNIPEIENFTTRAQLLVSGILGEDTIYVIVNHWPSRRGGEEKSRDLRIAAAELTRSIADSIFSLHADANIIVMGDLNDDPTNESVKKHLNTVGDLKDLNNDTFYNPFEAIHAGGTGSLAYRDFWNLFDQIIVSSSLCGTDVSARKITEAHVFSPDFLIQQEGKFKGYPFRTYSYDNYISGYSDHFPTYIFLEKGKKSK